jgi:hypothetical protein
MTQTIEEFLGTYPAEIQAITLKARALVREVMPDALEMVDLPAKMIAYGLENTYKGMICVISPYAKHVNLGFSRGTSLPDATVLLEGTGKNARHIKLKSLSDVERPAVRQMLLDALAEREAAFRA